ncbi:hypothetical protein AGMMS50262_15280 [Bacteroidia bacterium]|nr:hypothetical protein AGMMS50262_15280 [Bacteroidia bacterium]
MFNEATTRFIHEHHDDDVQALALKSKHLPDDIDLLTALVQIAGRQSIQHKIPSWYEREDLIYPVKLPLEQCSSEHTARYKAALLGGNSFLDLTGGFGVDTAFIAPKFEHSTYIERQDSLAEIAQHNFSALGLNIRILNMNGIFYLHRMENPVDCIYIDPARRSIADKRGVLIEDCDPNVAEFQHKLVEKAGTVLVKLSPMLDIQAALRTLEYVNEVHVVSVDNECKELLFLLKKNPRKDPVITCSNLTKSHDYIDSFRLSEENNAQLKYSKEVKRFIYEPNASLMKAGFYKSIAVQYGVEKLHPNTHLYTSYRYIKDFPGRIFQVKAVSSMKSPELNQNLKGIETANITVRNFPLSVAELRRKLKIYEGGETYLFATTLSDESLAIVRANKIVICN